MSTFDSTFLSGLSANLETLESELETKLPVRTFSDVAGSTSIATTTHTQLISRSVTLEADDLALILSHGMFSCGTTSDQLQLLNYQDSSNLTNEVFFTDPSGTTGGLRTTLNTFACIQDVSGTVAIKTMWARTSGAGTIYCYGARQRILVFKRRS